jgi:hypothetical protein
MVHLLAVNSTTFAHGEQCMNPPPPPRLTAILARDAPIAAVFRRGPSKRWQVYKWNIDALTLEPGGVLEGALYPEMSDLSPDGRLLAYFASLDQYTVIADPEQSRWASFIAISKLPWLTALAAWETCGRYTSGCRFATNNCLLHNERAEPFHGTWPFKVRTLGAEPAFRNLITYASQFCRARGVELTHESPLHATNLAWADEDRDGRLLTAHTDGTLGIWAVANGRAERLWSADLSPLLPRVRSPDEARKW